MKTTHFLIATLICAGLITAGSTQAQITLDTSVPSPGAGSVLVDQGGGVAAWSDAAASKTDIAAHAGDTDSHHGHSHWPYNTFLGDNAGNLTGTGKYNTASGFAALTSNTTGSHNTASGYYALTSNTTGVDNTATGDQALQYNTTGGANTASGYGALTNNTTGFFNTATGYYALYNNTTGLFNTASGDRALYSNTTGIYNTASGSYALYSNTTGFGNTASGRYALWKNTTGKSNTASGVFALEYNTTGNNNTAFGRSAGDAITVGNGNTIIGSYADPSSADAENQIVIGYNATGTGDNQIALGNTSITAIKGQVNFTTYSDSRIKRDIRDSELGLEFIKELRPVSYRWKNPADYPPELREERFAGDTGTRPADNDAVHDGLIAQEVREVLDRLGVDWSGWSANASDGKQGIQYGALTVPLVRAVQELDYSLRQRDEMVASLETELAAQKIRIDALLEGLTALNQQVAKRSTISSSGPDDLAEIAGNAPPGISPCSF